ncbi:MAG: hypothetical protein LBC85_12690 [Fibromonadaceae bacterium]|jgi:1,4-alpha-glucan branching enzyme|nr:hypothetical protein [Fibromonadaceae bacterium]
MALKKETKPVKAAKAVVKTAAKAVKTVKKVVKEAVPKKAVAAVKGKAVTEAEFNVFSPASGAVAVAGDFNSWKPVALKKNKEGNWSGKIKLSKGTHQYKIVFDNQYWETDKANPERIPDGHGGENSIRRV